MGKVNHSESCGFCVPEKLRAPHFDSLGVRLDPSRPLLRSETATFRPDLMPVHPEGLHGLLIPDEHRYNFVDESHSEDDIGRLLYQVADTFAEEIVMFEHGGTQEGGSNMSVYHQHLHVVGSAGLDVLRYMSDVLTARGIHFRHFESADPSPVVNLRQLFAKLSNGEVLPYIYIQQGRSGLIAIQNGEILPSQVTQKSMSRLLSGRELNWKTIAGDEDSALLSVTRVQKLADRFLR